MGEETRTFSRQPFEKETGLGLTTHKALELSHPPSLERLVDVAQDWAQGLVVISPVVFDPTAKDRIYLLGDVSQAPVLMSSEGFFDASSTDVLRSRWAACGRNRQQEPQELAPHQSTPTKTLDALIRIGFLTRLELQFVHRLIGDGRVVRPLAISAILNLITLRALTFTNSPRIDLSEGIFSRDIAILGSIMA